jgi:tetratricopeptide (TPR) repeat protein
MSFIRNIVAVLSDSSNSLNWLVFCLAFFMYANTLPNGYKYGDEAVATDENVLVSQGILGLPDIFIEEGYGWFDFHPLAKASFALEYALVGEYYLFSNYIQLLLFASICLVLFLVLTKIFPSTSSAIRLLAVLLFIVHPVNGLVINSMLGRAYLLGLLFIGLAILSIAKWMTRGDRKILVVVCLYSVLAMLSNAEMISWFLVPIFVFAVLNKMSLKKLLPVVGSLLIATTIYGLYRFSNVTEPSILAVYNPLVDLPDFGSRLPTGFFLLAIALKLLVFPNPLCSVYGYGHFEIMDWAEPTIYISIVVTLVLIITSFWAKNKQPLLALGAFIVIIGLIPFSNIFDLQPELFDEKNLFGASFGASLVFASLIGSSFKINDRESIKQTYLSRPFLRLFLALVFVTASYQTFSRNFVWANNYLLTTTEVEIAENSAVLNYKCGKYLRDEYLRFPVRNFESHVDSAAYYLERSVLLYDQWPASLAEFAELSMGESGQSEIALELYEKASGLSPGNNELKVGMARALDRVGRAGEAIELFGNVLEKEPDNLVAINWIVSLYLAENYLDEAEYVNQRFFQLHPNSYRPFMLQGQIFLARHDTMKALDYLNEALARNQNDLDLNGILLEIENSSTSSN